VAEREPLSEIQKNGELLVLLAGRRLRVRAADISISSKWLVLSELEISDDANDPLYNLRVRNTENNEEIFAMWM
jgi:predicted hotdog family 3-hydroxylacyl-ACP dehydratase